MKNSYALHIDKLEGEYKNKFEQVDTYCSILLDGIDSKTRNDVMSNILDTFISAQNDNLEVEKIIGNDLTKFCEEACKLPIKYKFKRMFELLKYWAIILLVFGLLDTFIEIRKTNFFDIKTDIGGFILTISICIILVDIYLLINKVNVKNDIKKNKISKKTKTISFILIVLCIIISVLVGLMVELLIPNWIVLLVSLVIVISYKICFRKEIKEEKKDNETVDFSDLVLEEVLKQSKEKYTKQNEKRSKKGKELISEEEYLSKQIKQAKNGLKIAKIYLFFPIGSAILFTIPVALTSKLFDTLIYFVILLIVESIIFIPLSKYIKKMNTKSLKKYTYFKQNNVLLSEWK